MEAKTKQTIDARLCKVMRVTLREETQPQETSVYLPALNKV